MKNLRIRYRKKRTCHKLKDMVAVQRNFIEKYIILSGSFLTISNALKQFPVLNFIIPEALSWLGCLLYINTYCFIKIKNRKIKY
ncbi:MAG: hypothetical protein DRH21_07405 [Deltaproteobacteria bacterium]|nr:MAG: hypothetical protein DRH21_07405 [Deltaproteobacteria bacterium]